MWKYGSYTLMEAKLPHTHTHTQRRGLRTRFLEQLNLVKTKQKKTTRRMLMKKMVNLHWPPSCGQMLQILDQLAASLTRELTRGTSPKSAYATVRTPGFCLRTRWI